MKRGLASPDWPASESEDYEQGYERALADVLNTAEVYFATDKATRNLLAGLIKRVREQA